MLQIAYFGIMVLIINMLKIIERKNTTKKRYHKLQKAENR
jgi:hypothetical protein